MVGGPVAPVVQPNESDKQSYFDNKKEKLIKQAKKRGVNE